MIGNMPISKRPNEGKSDWISRCISHEIKKGMEQDQSIAACSSMWESMRRIEEKLRVVREYRKKSSGNG